MYIHRPKFVEKTANSFYEKYLFFFFKNYALYELKWKKKMVETDRPQMTM